MTAWRAAAGTARPVRAAASARSIGAARAAPWYGAATPRRRTAPPATASRAPRIRAAGPSVVVEGKERLTQPPLCTPANFLPHDNDGGWRCSAARSGAERACARGRIGARCRNAITRPRPRRSPRAGPWRPRTRRTRRPWPADRAPWRRPRARRRPGRRCQRGVQRGSGDGQGGRWRAASGAQWPCGQAALRAAPALPGTADAGRRRRRRRRRRGRRRVARTYGVGPAQPPRVRARPQRTRLPHLLQHSNPQKRYLVVLAVLCDPAPGLRPQVGIPQRRANRRAERHARGPRRPGHPRLLAVPGVPGGADCGARPVRVLVRTGHRAARHRSDPALVRAAVRSRLRLARLPGGHMPPRAVSAVPRQRRGSVLLRQADHARDALLAAPGAPAAGARKKIAPTSGARPGRRRLLRPAVWEAARLRPAHLYADLPCGAVRQVRRAADRCAVPLRARAPHAPLRRPRCAERRVRLELRRAVRRAARLRAPHVLAPLPHPRRAAGAMPVRARTRAHLLLRAYARRRAARLPGRDPVVWPAVRSAPAVRPRVHRGVPPGPVPGVLRDGGAGVPVRRREAPRQVLGRASRGRRRRGAGVPVQRHVQGAAALRQAPVRTALLPACRARDAQQKARCLDGCRAAGPRRRPRMHAALRAPACLRAPPLRARVPPGRLWAVPAVYI